MIDDGCLAMDDGRQMTDRGDGDVDCDGDG